MNLSRKMVATLVLSNRLRRSLFGRSSSSTLMVSCALTVCSSSFIDWISSLRGLQFLVGRLQFLVDRMQFLVGGFQFLQRRLVFFGGGLHLLAHLAQLAFELFDGRVLRSAAARSHRAGCNPVTSANTTRYSGSGPRASSGSTVRTISWTPPSTVDLNALANDRLAGFGGAAQHRAQLGPQATPCHRHQVARWCALRGLQVLAGAAGEMPHLALGVDHDERRREALQHARVGLLRHIETRRCRHRTARAGGARCAAPFRRQLGNRHRRCDCASIRWKIRCLRSSASNSSV